MASLNSLVFAFSGCCQLIFVLHLWFLSVERVSAVPVYNRTHEVDSLLSFRASTIDRDHLGYWVTWNGSDPNPCAWAGVRCTANFTVEGLDLSGWGLRIGVLDHLFDLSDLRYLDLSSNPSLLSLQIPNTVRSVSGLNWLDVSRTFIKVQRPVNISILTRCPDLRVLGMEQSGLTVLPDGISNLVHLQFLNLAGNNLTGPFPTQTVGALSNLVSLDLSRNSFNGSIPSLPSLTNLVKFNLDNNTFSGFDDSWLLGTNSLQYLSVSNNLLQGAIPSSMTTFPDLLVLNMSRNKLSGPIPTGFSVPMMNHTLWLDLSENQLTGEFPPDILQAEYYGGVLDCSHVNASYNSLSGSLPIPGSNRLCIDVFDLSHNNISGPIDNIFSQGITWTKLMLGNNLLHGDVVDFLLLSTFQTNAEVYLDSNFFTGDLERLGSIIRPYFKILDFSNNRLRWKSSWSGDSIIFRTLGQFPLLTEFWAGGNDFWQTALPPDCLGTPSVLAVLDLSNTHLEGEISGAAFNSTCRPSMQLLNLSNNDATGSLTTAVILHDNENYVLDVSNNGLSGPLPPIPTTSKMHNPKYFAGNGALCGDPLPPCVVGKDKLWWACLIVAAAMTVAVGIFAAVGRRWRVYQTKHEQDADLIRTLLERDSAALMSLRELKDATDNFADSAQIGEGGFGRVYMGKLNDGTRVAIKRSKRDGSEKDKEQFLNEVRILSQVNHRHLVKLLGCCMENKIAVLVFEYVSNGTLQQHLQGKIGAAPLTWIQRVNIAIQTAEALNYLHSAAEFPIIHRDVKSANILVDDGLNAKVADFGISKLAPLQATHVSTLAMQGTIGYMDPEYYSSGKLTDKSDVHSFGVVLLELISAKPALDFDRGGDETSLVYFASPYIERGDLQALVDPALLGIYNGEDGIGRESILGVGKLAMKCVEARSKARPSMYEVLKELQNLLVEFNGIAKPPESIIDDDSQDLQRYHDDLLSHFVPGDSFSFAVEGDAGSTQLSQSSGLRV